MYMYRRYLGGVLNRVPKRVLLWVQDGVPRTGPRMDPGWVVQSGWSRHTIYVILKRTRARATTPFGYYLGVSLGPRMGT